MHQITKQEYEKMTKAASPPTREWRTLPAAFAVGGGICTAGQILLYLYQKAGLSQEMAGMGVSVSLIFMSVLATACNVYDVLAQYAGAGTLVPITGFANAVASPALEFRNEGLILGVGARIFSIAGPVILYGTAASCIYGLIYYLLK